MRCTARASGSAAPTSPRAADTGAVPFEYQPDKLHNYEVGLKSQWLDNRLQVNVDFFFMQWDDFQLRARAQRR